MIILNQLHLYNDTVWHNNSVWHDNVDMYVDIVRVPVRSEQ